MSFHERIFFSSAVFLLGHCFKKCNLSSLLNLTLFVFWVRLQGSELHRATARYKKSAGQRLQACTPGYSAYPYFVYLFRVFLELFLQSYSMHNFSFILFRKIHWQFLRLKFAFFHFKATLRTCVIWSYFLVPVRIFAVKYISVSIMRGPFANYM